MGPDLMPPKGFHSVGAREETKLRLDTIKATVAGLFQRPVKGTDILDALVDLGLSHPQELLELLARTTPELALARTYGEAPPGAPPGR